MEQFRRMSRMAFFVMLACLFSFGCESKEDRLIKQREERNKKIAADTAEAVKKSYSLMMDDNRNDRTNAIRSEFENEIESIETRYRLEEEDTERRIQQRRKERARY